MAKQRFLNNFTSIFIAAVKDAPSSGTPETELDYGVLRISDGAAGSLINPPDGDYYLLTAFKRSGSVESNIEVMRVTGVNNATPGECRITVQRAQEGTSAKAFVAGDHLSLRITKGTAENFSQPADLATKEPVVAAPGSNPTGKYWRGDKTWHDFFTDVRAATLTGLSTATNAVVAATDTVLAAIGKLQAQVSAKFDKTGGTITGNVLVQQEVNGVASIVVSNTDGVGLNAAAGLTLRTVGAAIGYMQLSKLLNELQIGTSTNTSVGLYINGDIALRVGTDKSILATSGALGYGVGAGGTVKQPTSKSTAVTLNKPSGQVSMHPASLAAGASVEFSMVNSYLSSLDGIVVNPSGFAGYSVEVAYFNGPTEVVFRVTNKGATRSDPVAIMFRIFKGAVS